MSDKELYEQVLKHKKVLDEIFYDNFHKSLPKFIYELKRRNINIKQDIIQFYYENQALTQIFKPVRKPIEEKINTYPIVSYFPFERVYIDTMYIKEKNRTLGFITIMDLFSKYAYSHMYVLDKDSNNISSKKALNTFQEFFIRLQFFDEPYLINSVVSDMGSEFQGDFNKYLIENDIKHYVVDAGNKKATSPIERFNGTLRLSLMKFRFLNNNKTNNEILVKILTSYNDSVHSSLGMSPLELLNNENKIEIVEKLNTERTKVFENKIPLSGYCRIQLNPDRIFKKIGANWSVDIYKIKSYNPLQNRYELVGGSKTYPEEQLQVIKKDYVMKPNIKIQDIDDIEEENQESIPAGIPGWIPVIREKSSRVRKARAVLDL
jgi:transposase InsO family protein